MKDQAEHVAPDLFAGGGEMAVRMRAHDWSATALGDPAGWPQSLRTLVSLMLNAKQPMFVAWGPELSMLYNDGYAPVLGAKHPSALGRPFEVIWSDIWEQFGPIVAGALAGESSWYEDLPITMERFGYREETWFSFSYTPVRDESGLVQGLFCACTETTGKVRGEAARPQSEEDYRSAAELNPQVAWTARPDGQLDMVSQRWMQWTGTTGLGETWAGGLHSDDLAATFEAWGRSVSTGEPYDIEHRVKFLNGEFRWARSRAFARRDERGAIVRWYGTTEDVHDQKTAQEALAANERRFRTLADNIAQLAWMTDETGSIRWYNQRWYDYTGTTFEAMQGWGWKAVHHPDEVDRVVERFSRAIEVGEAWEDIFPLRRADGAYRWFLSRALPIRDAAGRLTGWFGTNTDITELRQAEEALRASQQQLKTAEAQLRAILDSVPVGILMAEAPEGRVVQANRYLETLLRRPVRLGAPNHEGREAYDPEGRRLGPGEWPVSRVIRTGEPAEAEVRFRRGDDSLGWLRIQAAPIRDANGAVTGAVAGVTDLEEIVEARQVLARSRGELERRVDEVVAERNRVWALSQDLLVVGGFDGMMRAVNPAWSRLLGWDDETLLSTPLAEFTHPEDRPRAAEAMRQLQAGRAVLNFEDRLRRDDGRYLHVAWTAAAEGEVVYASGRDVTREREQEEQLRQAQKMEAVGQLTGGIAHDFNNLLQIVVGNLELTQRHLPEDAARLRRSVDNAMTGAKRAATLTQRLLAFSRRQPLAPKPVSANKLVAGMSELLSRSLGETIQVETVLAGGLWRVEVDPNQLENAIVNLAVNARDAMPDGGKLTIETANTRLDESYAQQNIEVRPGQYVVICVSDTGTGMSAEAIARAFEPFFTTKGVGKGTGLGLSQVYGFVKQSGGHVKIYSETGDGRDHHRGTTVKVYLPRYLGQNDEGEDEPEADGSPEGGLEETILVVEDDADVRAYTVEVLRELGYRVIEAADGTSALKLLRDAEVRCDLLFTDVVLPGGMNGEQLAREAHVARPGLKVLFTTGYARNAIVHHGRLDPGVKLITKPFTYADLAARVRDILDEPVSGGAGAA